jgi:hypothetical protein
MHHEVTILVNNRHTPCGAFRDARQIKHGHAQLGNMNCDGHDSTRHADYNMVFHDTISKVESRSISSFGEPWFQISAGQAHNGKEANDMR